ncbi:outer membrane beta-barrel protein [Flavitalea flava]
MKYRVSIILTLLLLLFFRVSSQQIEGVIIDSAGTPLKDASVKILSLQDSLVTISRADGKFMIKVFKASYFTIHVSLIGYRPADKKIISGNGRFIIIDTIRLMQDFHLLDTIRIISIAPVLLKGDTIEYRAGAYLARKGDFVEDLVRRFPGITVDYSGQIMAQGKKITKVTLNGKDFFGDDILIATRNLPSEIIKNIQVIQDYGEESKITGIKTGQPVSVLNINTRDDKTSGRFGQVTAGKGTDGHYLINIFANQFNKEKRLAFSVSANNTNAGLVSNDQLSIGANYGDRWSPILSGDGSYNFSHSGRLITGSTEIQSFFPNGSTLNDNSSSSIYHSDSHNLNYKLAFNIDPKNSLSLHSRFSNAVFLSSERNDFNFYQTDSLHKRKTSGFSQGGSTGQALSLGTDLLIIHHFNKHGRMISLSTSFDNNNNNGRNDNINNSMTFLEDTLTFYSPLHQKIDNYNQTTKINVKFTFIEPIGPSLKLFVNYGYINDLNQSRRKTFSIDSVTDRPALIDSLSDMYTYSLVTHLAGIGLNGSSKKFDYFVDISLQPFILSGNPSKNIPVLYRKVTLIPAAKLIYKSGRSLNLSVGYGAGSNNPGLMQLLPVTDLSNPQYPVKGNPGLKPSYTHNFTLSINKTNFHSGDFFFLNLGLTETQDNIVTNVINDPLALPGPAGTVIQETRYINVNGAYSLNSSYNYSKPFLKNKIVAGIGGGLNYNNNIAFINGYRSVNANWIWNQGLQLTLSPDVFDLSFSADFSFNKTDYSSGSKKNPTVNSIQFGFNARQFLFHTLLLSCDFSQLFTRGYGIPVGENQTILNIFLEQGYFKNKMVTLKLQGYNLFNVQAGMARSVSGNTITDSRINQIGRYFIFSGNIRLSEFYAIRKKQNSHSNDE